MKVDRQADTIFLLQRPQMLYIDFACLEPWECHVHLSERKPIFRTEAEQVLVL